MRKSLFWGIRGYDTRRLLCATKLEHPSPDHPPTLFGSRALAIQAQSMLELGEPTEIVELTVVEYS